MHKHPLGFTRIGTMQMNLCNYHHVGEKVHQAAEWICSFRRTLFNMITSQPWPLVTNHLYETKYQECQFQYFIFHLDSICLMLRIIFNILLSPSLIFPFYYVTRSFCNLANKMHFPDSRPASFLLQGLTRHFTLKV